MKASDVENYEVVADLNKISVNKDDSIIISCFMYDDVDLDYVNKMGIAGKEKAYLRNIIIKNRKKLSSVQISSAITAYARVYMRNIQYSLESGCKVYYTDTDSMVINKQLPVGLCSSEIGKFRLECSVGCVFGAEVVYVKITRFSL